MATLATNPQNPAFAEAIRIYVSTQGPLSDKPRQLMQDLDGDGLPEAIVRYCVDQNMPGGKFAGANNRRMRIARWRCSSNPRSGGTWWATSTSARANFAR